MAQTNPNSAIRDRIMTLDRETAYTASLLGQRFSATHQTPGTAITGQTSFVATTPTLMIYQSSAATRIVLSSLSLFLAGTAPGGTVDIAIAIDTANRYASGGTAITPQNGNAGSTASANATFRYNPTASTAGSGTRYIAAFSLGTTAGTGINYTPRDGIIIPATGSILVYTWAATTGPTWRIAAEWIEETI